MKEGLMSKPTKSKPTEIRCDLCGGSAVAQITYLTVSGYTDARDGYEFSFDSRVSFRGYGVVQPATCQEHRATLVDRLVRRMAPRPAKALRSLNWTAELTDRTKVDGRRATVPRGRGSR